MDGAGNESAPSNSVYLNFTLLPVSGIRMVQREAMKRFPVRVGGNHICRNRWAYGRLTVSGFGFVWENP